MAVYKTLTDILNADTRYDVNKITFLTTTEDGTLIIPDTNLLKIYMQYVRQYVSEVAVTNKQKEFYQYRPHILSLDLYGTPDLAWLIMALNDKECPSKFYLKKKLRVIPPCEIEGVYAAVITKSNERLTENITRYSRLIGTEI